MTTATKNADAAGRLWREVQRLCVDRGVKHPKSWLSREAQVSRPALDNWLDDGGMPTADGMERIATALGVTPDRLWLRWLDIPLPDAALERIATALEHIAYADPPSSPEAEALEVSRRAAELARDAIPTSPRRSARRRVEA